MVVRGGYGEFTETWAYNARQQGGGPFQLTETYQNQVTNGVALLTFPNPFPSGTAGASVPSQSVTAYPMKTDNGVIRQFNLTIEKELWGMGLRTSYIGSRGSGLNYSLNINKPKPGTVRFTNDMKPWPQFVNTTAFRNDGAWHYDSLQAEVRKRMGSFTFNSNWTWSNSLYNYYITENPYDVTSRWARDAVNRRHYWVTSFTWALPFGKERRFLSNAPGIVNNVLGGWGVQWVTTMATGGYFSPSFSGSDPSNTNTSGGLPDRVADGNKASGQQTRLQWFDPTAFSVPTNGRFGNSGVNILLGNGINVSHMSLAKTFRVTERFKATLTGAFSNLFNHPHFLNPLTNISTADPGKFTATQYNYNPEKQGYHQLDVKLRLEW